MGSTTYKKPLRITFILLFICTIIAAPLVYLFIVRTPDSTYQTVENHIRALDKAGSTINRTLEDITVAKSITDTVVSDLETSTNQYSDSLKSLVGTIETAKDAKLTEALNQNKASLTNFSVQANNITAAIQKYWAILEACSGTDEKLAGVTTTASFNTVMSGCIGAVDATEPAPASDFTSQFLSTYHGYSTDLIAAHKNRIQAKNSKASQTAVEAVKSKMQTLAASGLDLSPGGEPKGLEELKMVIATQKSALIR